MNIVAAQQVDSNARHGSTSQTIKQHGSRVTAGGGLGVEAANDAFVVGSELQANGNLSIGAGNNLFIGSAADEQHSASKTRKVKAQEDHIQQVGSTLSGDNIHLSASNDTTLISSNVIAANQAYLYTGNDLNVLANQNSDYSLYDKKDKGSFGALKARRDEVTRITHVGSRITTGADLVMRSGNDQNYQAAVLESGNDTTLDSGGAIAFKAVKDLHDESHTKTNNNAFWNAAKGKGNSDETLRQTALLNQGSLAVNAVKGLQIDVTHINRQTFSQSIDAMVKADPKLAWIKDAEARGDVDWRQVKEIHESFQYNNSGLGPASQLIVAIAMAATVGPAALGAAAGAGTTVAAGAGAVATAAATKGTVSLINNRGDLGAVVKDVTSADAIKGYAISGLTAGLTAQYFNAWTGTEVNPVTGEVISAPLNTTTGIMQFAGNQALQNTTSTLLGKALGTGASGSDILKATLFNTLAAVSFQAVGDFTLGKFDDGTPQKVLIHAMVGGLLSEATGGDFKTGALAAGASELVSKQLAGLVNHDKNLTTAASQIVGVLAASAQSDANSQSLDSASWVAKNATQYNRQLHSDEDKWLRENAKAFAAAQDISEQVALERLSQQSLKDVDYIWRSLLSDGNDEAAQAFLSDSGQKFINEHGEQQKLFTADGNQLTRMEMYADTADPQFYKSYVQSGISRDLRAGLIKELKDSGAGLKEDASNLYDAVKNNPGAAAQGIWTGIKNAPEAVIEGFKETGTALGEGAAVAFDDDITAKLNAIYGMDVETAQKALLFVRTSSILIGVGGKAAKEAGGKLTEAVGSKLDDVLVETAAKLKAKRDSPAPDLKPGETKVVGGDRLAANDGSFEGLGGGAKGASPTLREIEVTSGSKGAWSKDLNKPQPNTIYKVDGNKTYQTDSLGRVERVESKLYYTKNDRNTYQQCVAGKCGVAGDEGGHLIASIFNGPGEKLNLLPMNGNLNKGAWKSMENAWTKALKNGKPVNVKIEPIYSGSSMRPDRFNVIYSIDGSRPVIVDFKNAPGGQN